ncbi:2-succinyl-5-enolpyruvyl-6-hydroxy-3-cyclohexene-1-carboxylate synthase [Bienertia sinuspersici]
MEITMLAIFTTKLALVGTQHVVGNNINAILDQEPSEEDIKEDLFQMHTLRTYGMHALFFKSFGAS